MRDLNNLEEILEKASTIPSAKELDGSAMATLVKEYYDDIFRRLF